MSRVENMARSTLCVNGLFFISSDAEFHVDSEIIFLPPLTWHLHVENEENVSFLFIEWLSNFNLIEKVPLHIFSGL